MFKKLTILLLFFLCSTFLFAQDFAGGEGTLGDPYQVATAQHLYNVRNYSACYFVQTNNIDLSSYSDGEGWVPIPYFTGKYDGQYHTITNLIINRPTGSNVGLFNTIDGGSGLGSVVNLVITHAQVITHDNGGIIATLISNGASIINCGVEGSISGAQTLGGVVAYCYSGSFIDNSYSICSLTGNQSVGGISGQLVQGTVRNCYFKGTLTESGETPVDLAGISGTVDAVTIIDKCYATGVSSTMNLTGILGDDTDSPSITDNYYNADFFLSGNGYGTPLYTAQMKDQSVYANWDFAGEAVNGSNDYWSINPSKNDGYPYLTWQDLVIGSEPGLPQTSNLTLAETGWTQIRLTWTKGTGERRAVFMKNCNGENYTPTTQFYSVNRTYGNSSPDNGWYCVYDGTGSGAIINGLITHTVYTVQVFEYDGNNGSQTFKTDIIPDVNSKVFSTIEPGYTFAHGVMDTALVQCAEQLDRVRLREYYYYKQDRDIDLDGYSDGEGWVPICNVPNEEFSANYDGGGHEIRNLYINAAGGNYVGLFSTSWTGSLIKNVKLVNVNVTGVYGVGGLLGWGRSGPNCTPGTIINCSVSGAVNGESAVGGLVGTINGWSYEYIGSIKYCSSSAVVTGTLNYVGGLIGFMENDRLSDSYATGNIIGNFGVGGLLGHMNSRSTVQYCYSLGTVSGSSDVGNFLGNYSDETSSGSPNYSRIINSYFNTDIEAAIRGGSEYGMPLNTSQLKNTDNLWGWDFINVWKFNLSINNGYPCLKYVEPIAPVPQASNISFADVATDGMTINWTNGSGTARVVFVKRIDAGGIDPFPINGVFYMPNSSFGSGSEMSPGSNWYCVYNGNGNTISVSNLAPGTDYNVEIFEYNGPAESQVYNTSLEPGNQATHSTQSHFSDGDGTEKNPYQLSTITDFTNVRYYTGKYFMLTGNIDLSSFTESGGWTPFGTSAAPFNNSFDGNGFTISGLTIGSDNPAGPYYMGLFGAIAPGVVIQNVRLSNVNITAQGYVGALAGKNEGQIINCQVTSGTITIPPANMDVFAGGLVGTNLGIIENSYASISIIGNDNSTIGGLVGQADGTGAGLGTITSCYSAGQVSGKLNIGGLIGSATGNAAIDNCYSICGIHAVDFCGGFVGSNSANITNCYSNGSVTASAPTTIGGFIGSNSGGTSITSCYFDTQTSGVGGDPAAAGRLTIDMTANYETNYTDWDFVGIWSIDPAKNNGYPYLQASQDVLPVELTSFTASAIGNKVKLNWATATEINNYGFEVERALLGTTPGHVSWNKVGFVAGAGNSNSPKKYIFEDANAPAGKLQYRLKQIDSDGRFNYYPSVAEVNYSVTGVEERLLPTEYSLAQNYPNPFNPTTNIKFALVNSGFVTLKVYDVLGNEVAVLVNEYKNPGFYNLQFNAGNLSSGVYIYRITAGSFVSTKKLLLLK